MKIYNFEDDREIYNSYFQGSHDTYCVPVVEVGDIKYGYRVDVYFPKWIETKSIKYYTVALATNPLFIEKAKEMDFLIEDDHYNPVYKLGVTKDERSAYELTKFIALSLQNAL